MSWGKGSPHHCARVRDYADAVRVFGRRGPVRSRRWGESERPLVTSTETWFKIMQGPNAEFFDLFCGGDMPMIRYFRPDLNGEYTVWLSSNRYSWRAHRDFLACMGWSCKLTTTTGQEVCLPISADTSGTHGQVPDGWSAVLRFNADKKLIVTSSDHRPIYTTHSSKADKEGRKNLHKLLEKTLDLLMLRIPSLHQESTVSRRMGWAFGTAVGYDERKEMSAAIERVMKTGEVSDDILGSLLPFCQAVYNGALSREAHNEGAGLHWGDQSGARFPQLSEAKFKKSLKGHMVRLTSLRRQTGYTELPKFPAELPKKYRYFRPA